MITEINVETIKDLKDISARYPKFVQVRLPDKQRPIFLGLEGEDHSSILEFIRTKYRDIAISDDDVKASGYVIIDSDSTDFDALMYGRSQILRPGTSEERQTAAEDLREIAIEAFPQKEVNVRTRD